jgi:hypothetical protein
MDARIKGDQTELPGVTPSRGSPPHPQGAQEEGDEEHANAGEQQVQQALHDNALPGERSRYCLRPARAGQVSKVIQGCC